MRLFIGIDIPETIKNTIYNVRKKLEKYSPDLRWVQRQNLHITLKFLGETEEIKIQEVKKIISNLASDFKNFEVSLRGLGFFPNSRKPRVFFVSIQDDELLKSLALKLEDKLERIGFEKENKFKSHITIARVKNSAKIKNIAGEIKNINLEGSIPVKEISLIKSKLTSQGPLYENILRSSLAD